MPAEFVVHHVGHLEKTGVGIFVECKTDRGTVAVWGKPMKRENIDAVERAVPPFRLSASKVTSPNSNFPEHSHWIPDYSKIEISPVEEEMTESGVTTPRGALQPRPGSSIPRKAPRDLILEQISAFLRSLDQDDRHGPATLLYNESWLLRLVLGAAARGIRCLPEPFEPGARWFSEARLYTPFASRARGDMLAESHTHADGVIGHFEIGRNSRAGLHLAPNATQFIITEAKMFSGLSAGTTRAANYDQAARNVACLAWTVYRAKRPVSAFRSLAFWVLAPERQIRADVFACVNRDSVRRKIEERIAQYDPEWRERTLDPWAREWLTPVLDRLAVRCVTWEEVIADVERGDALFGAALREFHGTCLRFNGPATDLPGELPERLGP